MAGPPAPRLSARHHTKQHLAALTVPYCSHRPAAKEATAEVRHRAAEAGQAAVDRAGELTEQGEPAGWSWRVCMVVWQAFVNVEMPNRGGSGLRLNAAGPGKLTGQGGLQPVARHGFPCTRQPQGTARERESIAGKAVAPPWGCGMHGWAGVSPCCHPCILFICAGNHVRSLGSPPCSQPITPPPTCAPAPGRRLGQASAFTMAVPTMVCARRACGV